MPIGAINTAHSQAAQIRRPQIERLPRRSCTVYTFLASLAGPCELRLRRVVEDCGDKSPRPFEPSPPPPNRHELGAKKVRMNSRVATRLISCPCPDRSTTIVRHGRHRPCPLTGRRCSSVWRSSSQLGSASALKPQPNIIHPSSSRPPLLQRRQCPLVLLCRRSQRAPR